MHDQPEVPPDASIAGKRASDTEIRERLKRVVNQGGDEPIPFWPGDYLFDLSAKVVLYVRKSYLTFPLHPLDPDLLRRSRALSSLRDTLLLTNSSTAPVAPAIPDAARSENLAQWLPVDETSSPDWVLSILEELYNSPALQQPLAYLVDYVPGKWLLEQEAAKIWEARVTHRRIRQGKPWRPVVSGPKPLDPLDPDTWQAADTVYDWARESGLRGLCLSGGGIRSATFNLGILQGLAARQSLNSFDYLSSVSGGGYIHGWLAAWLRRESGQLQQQAIPAEKAARQALQQVQAAMAPIPDTRADTPRGPKSGRLRSLWSRQPSNAPSVAVQQPRRRFPAPELLWLRQFSNYLTPQKGLLTLDTWTAAAIWLRNTFLNQLALISALLFLLLLPWLLSTIWEAPVEIGTPTQAAAAPPPARYTLTVKSTLDRGAGNNAVAAPPLTLGGQATLAVSTVAANTGERRSDRFKGDYLLALKEQLKNRRAAPDSTASQPASKSKHPTCASKDRGITLYLEFLSFGLFLAGSFSLGRLLRQEFRFIRELDEAPQTDKDGKVLDECQVPYIEKQRCERDFGGPWQVRFIVATLLFPSIPFCYALCCPGPGLMELIFAGTALFWLCMCVAIGGNAFCRPGLPSIKRWLKESAWKQFFAALGASVFGTAAFVLAAALIHTATVERLGAHLMRCSVPAVELALGVPLLASLPFFTVSILIGLVGHSFVDWLRELLGRILAITLLATLGWLAFFSIALLSPGLFLDAVRSTPLKVSSILAWIGTTIASVLSAKSPKTGDSATPAPSSFSSAEVLATVGPYVYILGLLVVLSSLVQLWVDVVGALPRIGIGMAVTASLWAVLSWRLDATAFSLFPFYRNRLTRCYLGASNGGRNPNPLTGFDDRDTAGLQLKCLTPAQGYPGPYPIFCATLNLTTGTELAYQERKGASFAFTPCYTGYAVSWTEAKPGTQFNGYVPTDTYASSDGGLNLATVMAVSGAAISPNWGFHSKPATAFLLTMFNARLGRWLPNTRRQETAGRREMKPKTSRDASPNGFALLNELLGRTDDSQEYIYLSDGGHFDNMGLYELVRRRCYHIVICDAEEDEEYIFDGIGSTIRKCRIDFGVDIQLDLSKLRRVATTRFSSAHVVTGTIRYPEATADQQGTVTYIKASLVTYKQITGSKGVASDLPDLPADVQSYYLQHKDFPHDSTLNQWFTESQFESYRRLGQAVIEAMPSGSFD